MSKIPSTPPKTITSKNEDLKWLEYVCEKNNFDPYRDDIFRGGKYRNELKEAIFRENRVYLFLFLLIIENVKIIYGDEKEFRYKVIFALENLKIPIIGDKAVMDIVQEYCLYAIKQKNYIFLNAMETLLYHNRDLIKNVKNIKYKKYSCLYSIVAYNIGKNTPY